MGTHLLAGRWRFDCGISGIIDPELVVCYLDSGRLGRCVGMGSLRAQRLICHEQIQGRCSYLHCGVSRGVYIGECTVPGNMCHQLSVV